jgi:ribosome-associated protein
MMGITEMPKTQFTLRGEYIALDDLLKASGLAPSGGAAKILIASGAVLLDGVPELRKTKKVRAGQVVRTKDEVIDVLASASTEQ